MGGISKILCEHAVTQHMNFVDQLPRFAGDTAADLSIPTTSVELSVRATRLADCDTFSKSDPFCVLFQKVGSTGNEKWMELGRTEVIKDCLNPEWTKKFILHYNFEVRQMLKFEIYDEDASST